MADGGRGDMTLVVALGALQRLARPAEAVAAARNWSEYVGVAADQSAESMKEYLDANGVDPDFLSATDRKAGSLAAFRQRFPTDRHVFVGASETDRQTAQALGWEYLPVDEAAEKAEWPLAELRGEEDQ